MRRRARRRIKRRRRILAVGLVALLAGCSSIPDAVNPMEWYKGARDLVFGKEEQSRAPENARNEPQADLQADPRAGRGQAAPGAGQPIPNLNTVPERPRPSSREQRGRVQGGLVSDRNGARRYSREAVRRQGDPVNPLQTLPQRSPQVSPQAAARSAAPRIETPPRAATPSPRPRSKPPVAAAPAPRPAPKPPAPAPRQAAPKPSAPPPQVVQAPPAATAPAPAPRRAAPKPSTPPQQVVQAPQARSTAPAPQGGEFETIVISSAGVQTVGGAPASLSEFNQAAVRGSYQVATIMFRNGSSRLDSRDRRIIRQVFAQQRQTGGTVRIIGHASRRTADMPLVRHKLVNFRVSAARADAVAGELIRIGARPGSLFVRAVSSRYPRYHEYMPSGEAGNRRAEIFIDF